MSCCNNLACKQSLPNKASYCPRCGTKQENTESSLDAAVPYESKEGYSFSTPPPRYREVPKNLKRKRVRDPVARHQDPVISALIKTAKVWSILVIGGIAVIALILSSGLLTKL